MLIVSANISRYIPDGLIIRQPELNAISLEAGRGIWADVAKHFRRMGDATHSRHWWQEARSSIAKPKLEGNKAVIEIGQRGVRLQWLGSDKALGGPLRASGRTSRVTGRPTKSLLIPFDDSPLRKRRVGLAEMKIPNEEIVVLPSKNGKAPVMYWVRERKRKSKDGYMHDITPLGVLLRSVTIRPKPEVMPTQGELAATAQAAAAKYIRAKHQ